MLQYLWIACFGAAVFLGPSRRGVAILPAARVMLVPGGALLSLHAVLGLRGNSRMFAGRRALIALVLGLSWPVWVAWCVGARVR